MRLPLAALVAASLTLASSAFAEDIKKSAKSPAAAPTHKPKAHAALVKKHPSKVAKVELKKEDLKKLAEKKAEPKKAEPKKDEPKKVEAKKPDAEQPPEEMSGYFPQAKAADKKKKDDAAKKAESKKDDGFEKKSEPKVDPKKDDKKLLLPHSGKKTAAVGASGLEFQKLQKQGVAAEKLDKKKMKSCLHPAINFARLGQATDVSFSLTTCGGGTAPGAVDNLSILARPYDVPAPGPMSQPTSVLSLPKKMAKPSKALAIESDEISPGIRRVNPGLVSRIQAIADKFPGKTITLVSGYRPASKGSPHQAARAMDIRIDGVTNENLVAFCKTLQDTGCGYYPNSYFVHVDVRPSGIGHVYWIDTSGPGEKPNYVKQWPPPLPKKDDVATPKLDELPATTDTKEIGPLEDADDESTTSATNAAPTN